MSRSIIVMPDEGAKPLLEALAGAKKSLRVKMFLFDDPALLAAVIEAQKRGVKVRVILNPARRGGEPENEATRKRLEAAGVEVEDANPEFVVTHEKSAVVVVPSLRVTDTSIHPAAVTLAIAARYPTGGGGPSGPRVPCADAHRDQLQPGFLELHGERCDRDAERRQDGRGSQHCDRRQCRIRVCVGGACELLDRFRQSVLTLSRVNN